MPHSLNGHSGYRDYLWCLIRTTKLPTNLVYPANLVHPPTFSHRGDK